MDRLTGEARDDAVARIQAFFRDERGEELGDLAAGIVLDFVEAQLAWRYYDQGIKDAKGVLDRFLVAAHDELDVLEVLPPR